MKAGLAAVQDLPEAGRVLGLLLVWLKLVVQKDGPDILIRLPACLPCHQPQLLSRRVAHMTEEGLGRGQDQGQGRLRGVITTEVTGAVAAVTVLAVIHPHARIRVSVIHGIDVAAVRDVQVTLIDRTVLVAMSVNLLVDTAHHRAVDHNRWNTSQAGAHTDHTDPVVVSNPPS